MKYIEDQGYKGYDPYDALDRHMPGIPIPLNPV